MTRSRWPAGRGPRVLCHVVHFFGKGSAFSGKSTTSSAESRRAVVDRTLEALRALPFETDVRVCGLPGASLVPVDVDLSAVGDPRHLVYAAIEHLAGAREAYDYFLVVEDDVLVTADVLERMIRFQGQAEVHEVLLPNRLESAGDELLYGVDLLATPGWRGMRREFEGRSLDVAQNPHSGLAFLSRRQLDYALARVDLARRDVVFGGYMASAFANLHQPFLLWRTREETAHHVRHLDTWTSTARISTAVGTVGRAPAGVRGFIDTVVVDGVICTVEGWAADAAGRPVRPDTLRLGETPVAGVRFETTVRDDVRDAGLATDDRSGFRARFSVLDAAPRVLAAPTVTIGRGAVGVTSDWPRAVAVRASRSAPEIPDAPLMPAPAVSRMTDLLRSSRCYLEYGTGGTTVLAARLGVPLAYCVESDPSWLSAVEHKVRALPPRGRQILLHADVGPVTPWGYPTSLPLGTAVGDYALSVWKRLEKDGASPDLVLVDGRFRVACLLASLLHARPGTRIIFDDYFDRSNYQGAVDVLSPEARHDRAAEFVVPADLRREAAWELLARYVGDPR